MGKIKFYEIMEDGSKREILLPKLTKKKRKEMTIKMFGDKYPLDENGNIKPMIEQVKYQWSVS